MQPHWPEQPKGLMAVGGQALVVRSVAQLLAQGYDMVRIVTGYQAEAYSAAFAGCAQVTLVYNPDFRTSGSLQSLQCGVAGLDPQAGQIAVLESDIVYENRAVEILKTMPSGILTSGPTGAGDEVYVWTTPASDQLIALSKDRASKPEPPLGELTGLNALSWPRIAQFRTVFADYLRAHPQAHYEDGLVAAARGLPIRCHLVPDLVWAEIDDVAMLRRAQKVVWPQIIARDAQSLPLRF
jgi:choline kinase